MAERQFIAGWCPRCCRCQRLINLIGDFASGVHRREVNREGAGLAGGHIKAVVGLPDGIAVRQQFRREREINGGDEQIAVFDGHIVVAYGQYHGSVQTLDLLQLR